MSATTQATEIPLVDLRAQYDALRAEILDAISQVLDGMHLYLGPQQETFERDFARLCGCEYAISLGTGTDALEMALRALDIGPDDEVITQPNSFIATAEAISAVGATPVFVDADPHTAGLDASLLEAAITSRTKAIIPVHLYGRPADMDAIMPVARARNIAVIEDACQAHGARLGDRPIGSLGTMACFSFYFSKNLGAYGEGGAVTTNDAALAERIKLLRSHGSRERYEHEIVGHNARMDELQAAVLNVKLPHLPRWNEQRRHNATLLSQALAGSSLELPVAGGDALYEVFHLYVAQHPMRDELRQFLAQRGVATGIHYPRPIHLQPAYADLGYEPGAFPASERLATRVLSLPMYAELTEAQIERIAAAVREYDAAGV